MSQIFGEFIEEFQGENETLELSFSFGSRSLADRWRNNRLTAYFLADYLANFLPGDEGDPQVEERLVESKSAVSYIGNELLENAVKFNEYSDYLVKFGIHILEKPENFTVAIFAKNAIETEKVRKFQTSIEQLLSGDANELYLQQIEKTAESEDEEASGLGLLTVINDYAAKLGWKFDTDPGNSDRVIVTTMAQIVV